jgi:TPR repeat protein
MNREDALTAEDQYYYGLYFSGGGLAYNPPKAARCFKLAADQGHAWAALHYSSCLRNGCGVPQDSTEAAIYNDLALQRRPELAGAFGDKLRLGIGEIKKEPEIAAQFYKFGADQNNDAAAQYSYAHLLKDGVGVKKNRELASHYFQMAAKQGHRAALFEYNELTGVQDRKAILNAAIDGYRPAKDKLIELDSKVEELFSYEEKTGDNLREFELDVDELLSSVEEKTGDNLREFELE